MVLPIYAGLERLPASLLDAAGDLGARPIRTFRSVIMPMLLPSIAAGSIFTFSLSLGDYILPQLVIDGRQRVMFGEFINSTLGAPNQPLAAAYTLWPADHHRLPVRHEAARRVRERLTSAASSRPLASVLGLASRCSRWCSCTCRCWSSPDCRSTRPTRWLAAAGLDPRLVAGGMGDATVHARRCCNSVKVALVATAIALVLGTLAAFALQRFTFFGRNAISFLMVLPIALPGIVTGIALQNTFSRTIDLGLVRLPVGFGFHSLVIAHATFCVVVAYNNVIARLRRSSPNLLEASADLGAHGNADVPVHHLPAHALGAARRRHPGLRPRASTRSWSPPSPRARAS